MNSTITFPPPEPTLKLNRASAEKWAATLAEERRRLQEDHDALRDREQNLREYETRLRTLQAEIESGRTGPDRLLTRSGTVFQRTSSSPFHDDPALQTAWEKVHRAREILEAEQKNLRDERIAIYDMEAQVKRREEALGARELRLAEREALVAAATPPPPASTAGEPTRSTVNKLTRAPFNMARSVFGGKKE